MNEIEKNIIIKSRQIGKTEMWMEYVKKFPVTKMQKELLEKIDKEVLKTLEEKSKK